MMNLKLSQKLQIKNPNVKKDKTKQLKPKKVSASKIFNQDTSNPINEADNCPPNQFKKKGQQKLIPRRQ